MCYHVLNRGNGCAEVFHKDDDYGAFLKLLCQAGERVPMRLLAYCLMPNHFHLVVWTLEDGDPPTDVKRPRLHPGPVPRGDDWLRWVNEPQTEAELEALRECISRGRPFGSESWQDQTAQRLGLEFSLRSRGRPRKETKK